MARTLRLGRRGRRFKSCLPDQNRSAHSQTVKFYSKLIKFRGGKIHFLDNKAQSSNLYIIFPPGATDARFIYQIRSIFTKSNARIISISYPSRFKSSRIEGFDSIDSISEYLYKFLKKLLYSSSNYSINIMAFSFGTAVVTRLLQNHSELFKPDTPVRIVLVNGGEFFGEKASEIFKRLFEPALNNSKYLKILRLIITTVFKFLPRRLYPNHRLLDLNEQWLSTIGYRINLKYSIEYPVVVIRGTRDIVITPESKDKLLKIYPNSTVVYYPGDHIYDYRVLDRYPIALEYLKNWIDK